MRKREKMSSSYLHTSWSISSALLTVSVLVMATAAAAITTTTEVYAEPSKPNHLRWCIDVTILDSEGNVVTHQSCGETKKDCHYGREAALNQPRPPISVSECYKQKLDELK